LASEDEIKYSYENPLLAPKSILHDNLMKIQGKLGYKIKSENEGTIRNGQSRDTGNIGRTILSSGLREEYTQMNFGQIILNLYIFHELAKL